MERKAQTATEYLIILAVVIVIALIVVGANYATSRYDPWCDPEWGVVLPFNESLCWQRDVSGGVRQWQQSVDHCQGLTLGSGSWDVPTIDELSGNENGIWPSNENSLLWWMNEERGYDQNSTGSNRNYGNWLNSNYGFVGFQNDGYWSGTVHSPGFAWIVSLTNGKVDKLPRHPRLFARVVCVSRN